MVVGKAQRVVVLVMGGCCCWGRMTEVTTMIFFYLSLFFLHKIKMWVYKEGIVNVLVAALVVCRGRYREKEDWIGDDGAMLW